MNREWLPEQPLPDPQELDWDRCGPLPLASIQQILRTRRLAPPARFLHQRDR